MSIIAIYTRSVTLASIVCKWCLFSVGSMSCRRRRKAIRKLLGEGKVDPGAAVMPQREILVLADWYR